MHPKPFADLPVSPANHFRLYFYAAVSQVLATSAERLGSADAVRGHFQGFDGYRNELLTCGTGGLGSHQAPAWWRHAIAMWEGESADFLPVRAIRDAAALDHDAMTLAFTVGLLEEDARFGGLFELLNDAPGQQRPTIGLLTECSGPSADPVEVRAQIRRLQDLGLLHVVNPDAPRLQRTLEVPGPIWDALRGERHERPAPWAFYRPPSELATTDELVVPESFRQELAQLPALFHTCDARSVIVRG